MKKYMLFALLLFGLMGYANNYNEALNKIESMELVDLNAIDYNFADYFLINSTLNRKIAKEFLIILPDTRILEKNLGKVSSMGEDVLVFLLNKKNEKLPNRSIKELKTLKTPKNVRIITIHLEDEYIDKFIEDTKDDTVYFSKYFKKAFYNKYRKVTRFNYLEVNHE